MTNYEITDSGERRVFTTGAQRDRGKGKTRPDLRPVLADLEVGVQYGLGGFKYTDRNWEKGMPISEYVASAERHKCLWIAGLTDENHLSALLFNWNAVLHHTIMVNLGLLPKELDDMEFPLRKLSPSKQKAYLDSLSFEVPEKL